MLTVEAWWAGISLASFSGTKDLGVECSLKLEEFTLALGPSYALRNPIAVRGVHAAAAQEQPVHLSSARYSRRQSGVLPTD